MPDYPVPTGPHRVESVVRRSRFIATLSPAIDPDGAHDFIRSIQSEFPDATHNCWAYVAGPPASTSRIGMSDDGEPHGTAGRPILHTLLHSGIGEVAAVVTRFFGGVKLGTGGLARAYSGSVSEALRTLPVELRTSLVSIRVRAPFGSMDSLFRLLAEVGGRERQEFYGEGVEINVQIPLNQLEHMRTRLAEITGGAGRLEEIPE